MHEVRRGSAPRGRHEATVVRGAHERVGGPRHAASGPRIRATTPVLASIAVLTIAMMAIPVVRTGAADAARAVGGVLTGVPGAPQTEAMGADGPYRPGGTASADDAASSTGGSDVADPGADPVQVTTTSTGQVVVDGLDQPFDPAVTSAFTPWFPPLQADGTPSPSSPDAPTNETPGVETPVEVPEVPIEFTPDPTPFPTETPTETQTPEPTPSASAEPTPSQTPSYEPSTPAPEPTPSPAPTTSAPSTTPVTPGPVSDAALRFSPPALSNPQVIAFPEGSVSIKLDVARDYILTLPRDRPLVNTMGLTIVGGRNVVIVGGTVDVRDGVAGVRRGAYLKDATPNGTTYIEGVRFLSTTAGALTEGIDIASPGARVVLQNIAITGALTGSYATNHADIVQAWAGPAVLQIDGLSASTRYQGFFLLPNQHDSSPVYDWSFHRVSLGGVDSAYLLWRDGGSYAIRTSDVYVSGSRYSGGGLWPSASAWPGVITGPAPQAYAAGAGYTYSSPGYR